MTQMTVRQVEKALKNNKYILLRISTNVVLGINCGILKTESVKESLKAKKPNEKTPYLGFRSCSFQEYLSNKEAFLC